MFHRFFACFVCFFLFLPFHAKNLMAFERRLEKAYAFFITA